MGFSLYDSSQANGISFLHMLGVVLKLSWKQDLGVILIMLSTANLFGCELVRSVTYDSAELLGFRGTSLPWTMGTQPDWQSPFLPLCSDVATAGVANAISAEVIDFGNKKKGYLQCFISILRLSAEPMLIFHMFQQGNVPKGLQTKSIGNFMVFFFSLQNCLSEQVHPLYPLS